MLNYIYVYILLSPSKLEHHEKNFQQHFFTGMFLVGGGGYACSSWGAGSGHFEYIVVRKKSFSNLHLYL